MNNSESFVGRGNMIVMMGRYSVVYIIFLGDLFELSCYGLVMARLDQTGDWTYIVSCRGLPGATSWRRWRARAFC